MIEQGAWLAGIVGVVVLLIFAAHALWAMHLILSAPV